MDTMKLFMAIPDRTTPLSSASISQAKEKPSPSTLPISPSPVIRHLGLVTSGQAAGLLNYVRRRQPIYLIESKEVKVYRNDIHFIRRGQGTDGYIKGKQCSLNAIVARA